MSFTGLVCSEDSTGDAKRRGAITKAGNPHLRRILVEAAWAYRHRNTTGLRS
jgi:transposase